MTASVVPTRQTAALAAAMIASARREGSGAEAACIGQHALFESTEYADHVQARRICADCPVIDWCRTQIPPSSGYPQGTWAGRLYGTNARVIAGETFRVCAICPAVFTVSRHRFKYCSDGCVADARRLTKRRHGAKLSRWRAA